MSSLSRRAGAGVILLLVACAPRARDGLPPSPGDAAILQYGAASARPDTPIIIPLSPYAGRLVTTRVVAGSDTLRMLFDTGAGLTLLMPDVARRLGCTPAGRIVGFRMSGDRVEFTGCPGATLALERLVVRHAPIGVFDLMALLPPELPRLDGILSLATFAGQTLTLNLRCRRLVVESAASARERIGRMRPLAARIATGASGGGLTVFLQADARPAPIWLELDSGNLDHVLLSPHAAVGIGLDTVALGDSAVIAPIPVTGLDTRTMPTAIRGLIHDGALNEAWIAEGELTLDLASGLAWGDLSARATRCTG